MKKTLNTLLITTLLLIGSWIAIAEPPNVEYYPINNQHNKMSQELTNFEQFGLYFGILFVTNLIEVSINNIIF